VLGRGCEKHTVKEEVKKNVEERNQDTEYLIFLGVQNGVSWDSVIFTVSHIQHKALRKCRSRLVTIWEKSGTSTSC
jgi:hypothetical protein